MPNIVIDEFDSFIDDIQQKYEIIRPVLLKQTTAKKRAIKLKLHQNTLSKYITRFKEHGMLGLADQRHGPKESSQWLTIEMKAEAFSLYNANPNFSYREIARIISEKYHRNVDYKSIQRVIDEGLSFLQHQKKFFQEKKNTTFAGYDIITNMQAELNYLRRAAGTKYHFENIIGRSAGIRQVCALMERAIDSGLTVLITGETGTGKELVAKAIHYNSPRKEHPLLDRNCGAIPKELLASDLFGHRKGAFTGANEDKIGLFEAASGGTVLLDEIGEMPQDAQVHLLRVLEERKVQRLGEHVSRDVDVRIISMTNRDPGREVLDGQFREDLYYRLSEFPIHIPSLRERPEDIPLLAEHFLQEIDRELDGFAPDVFEMLASYSWPGNVRELRNVVRRAAAFVEEGEQIRTYHFPPDITQGESLIQEILSERRGLSAAVERLQRRLVENALQECGGNRTKAAQMLEIHRSALVRLMKRLGVK